MTTVAVELPPRNASRIASALARSTALSVTEASDLLLHVAKDAIRAVDRSGGDLVMLVPPEASSEEVFGWEDPRAEARRLAEEVITAETAPTVFEPPESEARRSIAAVLSSLFRSTSAASAAILRPITPLVQRRHLDAAAMRLRTHDVVIGPSTGSRWYFAGVSDELTLPVAGADEHLTTLALAANETDRSLDLLPILPGVLTDRGLAGVVSILEASLLAEKDVAPATHGWIDEVGLRSDPTDPDAPLRRD